MKLSLTRPKANGAHPVVVVFGDVGDRGEAAGACERLAAEGFVAAAPDLVQGIEIGDISRASVARDLEAAVSQARGLDDVWGERIGCVGFGVGGHVAFVAAARTALAATACVQAARVATQSYAGGEPAISETKLIRGRLLCLFGGADKAIPMRDVDAIRAAIQETGARGDVKVYHGVGRGFLADPTIGPDAWSRVLAMFRDEGLTADH
jgi:carboxymethylenebutenolidase